MVVKMAGMWDSHLVDSSDNDLAEPSVTHWAVMWVVKMAAMREHSTAAETEQKWVGLTDEMMAVVRADHWDVRLVARKDCSMAD